MKIIITSICVCLFSIAAFLYSTNFLQKDEARQALPKVGKQDSKSAEALQAYFSTEAETDVDENIYSQKEEENSVTYAQKSTPYGRGPFTTQASSKAPYAYTVLTSGQVSGYVASPTLPIERFEIRHGDCAYEKDCATNRERAEQREKWEARHGSTVEYAFEMLIPDTFTEMKPKHILGQWHDGTGPVVSQRYELGHLWLDVRTIDGKTTKKITLADQGTAKGRWLNFKYIIHWSKGQDGSIDIYADGKKFSTYIGPTITDTATEDIYFKYGIYRSDVDTYTGSIRPTEIVFFRNYGRKDISSQ